MLYTVTLDSNIVEYQKFIAVSINKLQSTRFAQLGKISLGNPGLCELCCEKPLEESV